MLEAICLAVNGEDIVDIGVPGDPARFVAKPESASGVDALDTARQLLTEAGYPDGFEADLLVVGDDADIKNLASVIIRSLSQVGISVTPTFFDPRYESQPDSELFEIVLARIQ